LLLFSYLGFVSIALGTTVSCWCGAFIYQFFLSKNNLHKFDTTFKIRMGKIFLCSLIMSGSLYFLLSEFQFTFNSSSFSKIFYLLIIVGSSSAIYFLLSILFKSFSIADFKVKTYESK